MQLSVVIPAWSGTPQLAKMTLNLCKQVRSMCDELIVSEDGDYNKALDDICDYYLVHRRLGHALNLSSGIKAASGDFIAPIDSDVVITKGTLRDLCIPEKAGFGTWKEWPVYKELMGWCFVMDRTLALRHPIGAPELEGLGLWIADLYPYTVYVDSFEYSHAPHQSYVERDRLGGRTIGDIQGREVMWDRHRQRIAEDPIYRERWEKEES